MSVPHPVRLTEAARRQVRAIIEEKGIPAFYGLRVGLRGAGCGAQYLLGFDTKTDADDAYDLDGLAVLVDRRHLMYVLGLEIDFEAGDDGVGFSFSKTAPAG